jgi:hypothetical protein
MKRTLGAALIALTAATLSSCAAGASSWQRYMKIWPANYTEDFIHDFRLQTEFGKDIPLKGEEIRAFSKGGSGSDACCADLPGIGSTVRVIWRTGDMYAPETAWVSHSAVAHIGGATAQTSDSHSFLILRFFPKDQIEAEYITQLDDPYSPANPRIDVLFQGKRIMRKPGE